jgi:MHS family proline/betaine transporter-like MFS transporter
MTNVLHYTMHQALSINLISITLLAFLVPWMGKLSDRIGRRPLMAFALIGSMLWVWSYFWLLQQHNFILALLAQLVMTVFASAYFAIELVAMVEMVPIQWRFTVVSIAYAVAVSIFGGMTPFVATLLIKATQAYYSLALYLLVAALISLFAVYKISETRSTT